MDTQFTCLECSNHFLGHSNQTLWFQQCFFLPVGVGICKKCLMYGYGPFEKRRTWDPQWIDENLHETWNGCKEGEEGYFEGRPSEKNIWPGPTEERWKSFVYSRSWVNTLRAKKEAGLIIHGVKVPCSWYSVSQKKFVKGFLWCVKDDKIEVYRESTEKEKEKYGESKEFIRKKLNVNEIAPPEVATETLYHNYPKCYSCDDCGLAHTEVEESKDWKGRYFCHLCLHKEK